MKHSRELEALAKRIEAVSPSVAFERRQGSGGLEIALRSPSDRVGELVVTDDGEELTVWLGSFTHSHWPYPDAGDAGEEQNSLASFVQEVLADEVEFYGSGLKGGYRRVGKPRSLLSKLFFGSASYRWSGPVGEA